MERRDFLGTMMAGAGGVGLTGLSVAGCVANHSCDHKVRTRQQIDFDWRFHLGDIDGGAEAPSFNDKDWRVLDLPHDWSIEGKN